MPKSLHWRVANEQTDGKIEELLRSFRASGMSFDEIARHLAVAHGVQVTGNTIRNWAHELEIPDPKVEAAAGAYNAPSTRGVA